MFGKILRAGKGSHGLKYKIDVHVQQLEGLPSHIKRARVVWSRSAKMQMTKVKDVRGSVATYRETLTQVTTIYRDKSGKYEEKDYEFKVQVPGREGSDALATIGKATLNMAKFCGDETQTQQQTLPISFKAAGSSTTGYLKMTITSVFLGDATEDGMTEVSGMTGMTSEHGSGREQDLDGFHDEENRFAKRKGKRDDGGSAASASGRSRVDPRSGLRQPLPPTAEETTADMEEARAHGRSKKKHSAPSPEEVEEEPEPDLDDNPFAKKKSSKPAKPPPPPKKWEDDDDVSPISSDMSGDEDWAKKPVRAKDAARAPAPLEDLDEAKRDLFATSKKPAAASRSAAAAAAGPSTSGAGPSTSRGTTSSKSSSKAAPPPHIDDEDEEDAKRDLFAVKPKSKPAAAPAPAAENDYGGGSSKHKAGGSGLGKAAATSAAVGAAASAAAAPFTKSKSKSRAAPEPEYDEYQEEEDDGYGPSTSAAAAKSRSAKAGAAAVGAAAAAEYSSNGGKGKSGGGGDSEALRQRVTELEAQLEAERASKEELSRKVQKQADKIGELEEQLAEGDVAELFSQMKDMEAKYQAEMKELMDRHMAEMEEMEERHRQELEEAGGAGGGAGGASLAELERQAAALREQEAALGKRTAKLEAEQAAAVAAQQAAEAKLAEANRMIDDSLVAATRHAQENKALQEEISRLKRQLEEAAAWDTSAAVAAVTAASAAEAANGAKARGAPSVDEEELEELRDKIEELQAENTRLQQLSDNASRAAGSMLEDIRELLWDVEGAEKLHDIRGGTPITQLATGISCLCALYSRKCSELREAEVRLAALAQQQAASAAATRSSTADGADGLGTVPGSKVKPHELLSRVQQLTAERDRLQEQLDQQAAATRQAHAEATASLQAKIAELQQQVGQLAVEKEAVENFKLATIAELRKQNEELRSSLRSLSASPLATGGPPNHTGGSLGHANGDLYPAGAPATPSDVSRAAFVAGAAARLAAVTGSTDGNWQEFESLVGQLKADREELREHVVALEADKAQLERELEDLRRERTALGAGAGVAAAEAVGGDGSSQDRVAELERQCAALTEVVAKQKEQLADLAQADAIIKEWSDYAEGLAADKVRLEAEVQQLKQQLEAASPAGVAAAAATSAVGSTSRAAGGARSAGEGAAGSGGSHSGTGTGSSYSDGHPGLSSNSVEVAELRHEIARLEASLHGLRVQLVDTHTPGASQGDDHASSAFPAPDWRHTPTRAAPPGAHPGGTPLSTSSGSERGPWPARGWDEEMEHLRALNASLEVTVAGLQASLAVATKQQMARSGSAALSSARGGAAAVRSSGGGAALGGGGATAAAAAIAAAGEVEELRVKLAEAMQAKAQLEAEALVLRSDLERARLWAGGAEEGLAAARGLDTAAAAATGATVSGSAHGSSSEASRRPSSRGSEGAAEELAALRAEVEQLHKDRSVLSATVAGLRSEVSRLQEDKGEADHSIRRLSEEMEELAEALDAATAENERLSEEVIILQLQLGSEDARSAGSRGSGSRASALSGGLSTSAHSSRLRGTGTGTASSGGGGAHRGSAASGPTGGSGGSGEAVAVARAGPAHSTMQQVVARAAAAERDLAAARRAARELVWQVEAALGGSGGGAGGGGGGGEEGRGAHQGLAEEDDLAEALQALQVKVAELHSQARLARQSSARGAAAPSTPSFSSAAASAAATTTAEADLAKATARIDELEQLLEDAEIENQHLTEQLEEVLTAGRAGPGSVGSVAEEAQSPLPYGAGPGHVAAGHTGASSNPYSYGHAATLTLSALEQRLAMAEARRDELAAALEEAAVVNRRLEEELAAGRQQPAAALRRGDSADRQVPARGRGLRALEEQERSQARLEELQAANRKLEAVCGDLEAKADALTADLEVANRRIRDLEQELADSSRSLAELQRKLEEEVAKRGTAAAAAGAAGAASGAAAGGAGGAAALEAKCARLEREKAALRRQLEDEQDARDELEEQLKDRLDAFGDEEAMAAVAAFEAKYKRLKEDYQRFEDETQEELDELQDQLADAQGQVADLQRQLKQAQSQAAVAAAAPAAAGRGGPAANTAELSRLREENERVVSALVSKTMELAELSESDIQLRRELARLKELNMRLAAKATSLEAHAAVAAAGQGGMGVGGMGLGGPPSSAAGTPREEVTPPGKSRRWGGRS